MASMARSVPTKGFFLPLNDGSDNKPNTVTTKQQPLPASAMGQTMTSAPQSITLSSGVPSKPTSLGTDAGLAGSLPSSVPKSGRRRESIGAQMRKQLTDSPAYAAGGGLTFQRSTGQTIMPLFGAGRENSNAQAGSTLPSLSMSLGAAGEATMDRRERRSSVSSVATDDDIKSAVSSGQALHRCEACNKVYRHPNCLVKHRWEHTTHWKEASRFSMSKHQQVQLLEAAAILVGMDAEAHSLPDEKALWPAAVSPPTSGLLGSNRINFDLLRKQRAARKTPSERRELSHSYSTESGNTLLSPSSSLPAHGASSLSPLTGFNMLNIGRRPRSGTTNTDVASLRLDESAERSVREESAEDESDDEDDDEGFNEGNDSMTGSTSISAGSPDANDAGSVVASSEKGHHQQHHDGERYGLGAGGDVMAEMDMEMDEGMQR